MKPNVLILSYPTYGATPAATYAFMTKEYKPPTEERFITTDVVKNQNGKFKYVYDNGPGFRQWNPFTIVCEDKFATVLGAGATVQYARLREVWNHPGVFGMQTPEGVYSAIWSASSLEQNFRVFPHQTDEKIEMAVVVQFEEA